MTSLTGKIALVTGASRGIGRATALGLARAGAAVYLAADGTRDNLAAAAAECRVAAGRAEFGLFDLADAAAAGRMVEAALTAFGRIDILVNNAGMRLRRPMGEFSAAEFDQLMAVNLRAPFLACQAVIPSMRANRAGRIINIASQMGMVAAPEAALYGMSKAALIQLTKVMAIELAADNISVNTVSPGPIETEFTREQAALKPGYMETRAALVPLRRWGNPDEVAELVVFLASTGATFIHGSNFVIDGGYVVQ